VRSNAAHPLIERTTEAWPSGFLRTATEWEIIMFKQALKHAFATMAAAATTFALFSAVASIGDDDKAALIAARSVPGAVAANSSGSTLR